MSSSRAPGIASVIRSTLLGMAAFLVSGVIACIVIERFENYIVAAMIAGGMGGLLLALFLRMRQKIGRMTVASALGMPIGLVMSFLLVEGLGSLLPSVGAQFTGSAIPDIVAITLMGIVFGAIVGLVSHGAKSIWLFSIVCGTTAVPFGFLVGAFNSGSWLKVWLENLTAGLGRIDLNFLAVTISLGIGLGLGIGLYSLPKTGRSL